MSEYSAETRDAMRQWVIDHLDWIGDEGGGLDHGRQQILEALWTEVVGEPWPDEWRDLPWKSGERLF